MTYKSYILNTHGILIDGLCAIFLIYPIYGSYPVVSISGQIWWYLNGNKWSADYYKEAAIFESKLRHLGVLYEI